MVKFIITIILFSVLTVTPIQKNENSDNSVIKVKITLDSKEINRICQIKLYKDNYETDVTWINSGFILPNEFKDDKQIGVKFILEDYTINFGKVDIDLFSTNWEIGIDYEPFEKENVGHLPGEMRKGPGVLFLITFSSNELIKYKITTIERSLQPSAKIY